MIRTVVVALVAGAVGAAPVAGSAGEGTKAKEAPPSAFTLGLVQKGLRPGLTQADVARLVGRDRSTVANAIRLLKLPVDVAEMLLEAVG